MKLIKQLDDVPAELKNGAVTIGNFDGVHQGHAQLLSRLITRAKKVGGKAIVFTFDPHPTQLLRPESAVTPLTWLDRKVKLLAMLGVDALVAYPTDMAMLSRSPVEFFDEIVLGSLAARAMVEGPNFFFGRNRSGDIQTLDQLCRQSAIELDVVRPLSSGNAYVSSSRVRSLIRTGEIAQATNMLTAPYRIRGTVVKGAERGRQLGFPTANLSKIDTLIPAEGVYAGRAYVDGKLWPAAINIGTNPTFEEHELKLETHLIDYAGDLYGQVLEVDFLARLRDIHPFSKIEDLIQQLRKDIKACREVYQQYA